ncbi:MAG: hemerythrin domain-containing protein [Acidobacteriota bacterium]
MPVQIGARLDSGFDDPLGMLQDCHRRIERFLAVLCDVAERARSRALTAEEATAVRNALGYFREAGRRHNADEEESLFPRMRDKESARPAESALHSLDQLEADHRAAEALHSAIDSLYSDWLTANRLDPEQGRTLLEKTARLRALYAEHIHIEETAVFPEAARILDRDNLAAIGSEFRARRADGQARNS